MAQRFGITPQKLRFRQFAGSEEDRLNTNLQVEYEQVCNNFRTLTDIRFKLLAFLPIGTVLGTLLAESKKESLNGTFIGLFGLIVTFSVAIYNMRNDQLYNELVLRAAELERRLGLKDGAFAHRPRPWRRAFLLPVEHSQIWWIYWASMIAWLFIILHTLISDVPMDLLIPEPISSDRWLSLENWPFPPLAVISDRSEPSSTGIKAIFSTGTISMVMFFFWLQGKRIKQKLRNAVVNSVDLLIGIPMSESDPPAWVHDNWKELIKKIKIITGETEKSNILNTYILNTNILNTIMRELVDRFTANPEESKEIKIYNEPLTRLLRNASNREELNKLSQEDIKKRGKLEKSLLFYLLSDIEGFYWDCPNYDQLRKNEFKLSQREAAQLIALVTDMPPRWILDVVSGRR